MLHLNFFEVPYSYNITLRTVFVWLFSLVLVFFLFFAAIEGKSPFYCQL